MDGLTIHEKELKVFADSSSAVALSCEHTDPFYAERMMSGGKFYEMGKRMFDIIFSLIGIILTAPLFVLIAVLIKLDSSGPIIFKQLRVGIDRHNQQKLAGTLDRRKKNFGGLIFTIYKFRTMYAGSASHHQKPVDREDRRVTRLGNFLRRTSLDELPQLWNVLCGDMSLVGPRPEVISVVKKYGVLECQRLRVKPGLTGLWQLYGNRRQPIHKNLQYDLEYLNTRSFRTDFKIIYRTFGFVLRLANI